MRVTRLAVPAPSLPRVGASVLAAGVIGLCGCAQPGGGTGDGPSAAGRADAAAVAGVFDGSGGRWVDMTYAFSDETIYWPTDTAGFQLEQLAFGETEKGYFYAANRYSAAEHGGTHLDAPLHFSRTGDASDAIPLDRLISPAVVVDVTDHVSPDYLVSVADLEAFETANGPIPDGAIVLLRTGWGDRWPDRASYMGTPATGPAAIPDLHFPGLDPEAARWLVDNRSIAALGIDTPSVDYGQSTDFGTHVVLYGANIPGFENVAHMEELPATGSFVVALPMKIAGGSGGPLRIVGFVPG